MEFLGIILMVKPDYKGKSIVNLMSSIMASRGGKSDYKELKSLPSKKLKASRNVVLIVIDGLGYNFLKKHGKATIFEKYLKDRITSVFPSTTASAMTAINTGEAPQQHGLVGWFTYLKEAGLITMPLPGKTMIGGISLKEMGLNTDELYGLRQVQDKIKTPTYMIQTKEILRNVKKKKDNSLKYYGYKNLKGFFKKTIKAIKKPGEKYIQAYWPYFDEYSHFEGTESKVVKNHLLELSLAFEKFLEKIKGTNTIVIVTADHGMIDVKDQNKIYLDEYPKIKDYLSMPMSGDMFIKYCYVKADKAKEFEKLVKKKLSRYCTIHKSSKLVKNNYFGIGKTNPKLLDRIGDYTLIAKEGYMVDELVLGQAKGADFIGMHSGISKDEMYVPLIVVNC
jgi:predicted AlkP superfamily pyrophosphatase or phosphodiesterase